MEYPRKQETQVSHGLSPSHTAPTCIKAMVSRPASYLNFQSFLPLPFCPHPFIPHLILTVTLKNSVFLCITFSLPVDEHLGCFHVLAVVNSAGHWGALSFGMWFSLGICLVVGFLGHISLVF